MSLNDWNKSEIIERVRVAEGQNGLIQTRLDDALSELKRVREESEAEIGRRVEILRHLKFVERLGGVKHREDVAEVCYDWCPLCHLEFAMSIATKDMQSNPKDQK